MNNQRTVHTILRTPGCFISKAYDPLITKGRKATPVYIDLRVIPSYTISMTSIGDDMTELINNNIKQDFDKIATTETGGIPYGILTGERLNKGVCWVKKEQKGYGTEKTIEGVLKPGELALGVDDLVNETNTARKLIEEIRKNGSQIKDDVAVMVRNKGAYKTLSDLNVKLLSLANLDKDFITQARDEGAVPDDHYPIIQKYLEDTDAWSRNFVRNNTEYILGKLKVVNGEIKDKAPLEVFTVGHPELLDELKPTISMHLAKSGVKPDVPEVDYHPGLFN